MMLSISEKLKANATKNFLIIYILTGHGVSDKGNQVMLLNEFDYTIGYYQHWNVEEEILEIAKTCSNAYQIAFFCCCRDIWSSAKHYEGIGGVSHAEANLHFRKLKDAKDLKDQEMKDVNMHGHKEVIANKRIENL